MADPLGMTASILGILSLAEHIISTSVTFFKSFQNRRCSLQAFVREISSLTMLLHDTKAVLGSIGHSGVHNSRFANLDVHLGYCRESLKALVEMLAQHVDRRTASRGQRAVTQLVWPFREAETAAHLQNIERFKTTLGAALSLFHLESQRLYQDDQQFGHVIQWLPEVDSKATHKTNSGYRHPLTGLWFFKTSEFSNWQQNNNSFLRISAIPGAGKSVLASTIIKDLQRNLPTGHGFAYFYCVHSDPLKKDPTKVLASLVAQLCRQNEDFYNHVKDLFVERSKLAHQATTLDLEELGDILVSGSSRFAQTTLIIDALDECGENGPGSRSKLLNLLPKLKDQRPSTIRILATSRREPDIEKAFQGLPNISIEGADVEKDIEHYLEARADELIRTGRLKLRNDRLKEDIISAVKSGAGGMFLYVKCQLDYLCSLLCDDDIQEALKTLPKSLAEVYVQILEKLDKENDIWGRRSLGQKVIRYIAEAIRPMTLYELAEVISIKESQTILNLTAVATDPEDLLQLCGSLVRMNRDTGQISLAHFSVKEFLVSKSIQQSPVKQYYVDRSEVNTELAKVSLTYLSFKDFSEGPAASSKELNDRLSRYRFLEYAASYCSTHLGMVKDATGGLLKLMDQFFVSPTKLEDYTNDSELKTRLSKLTFNCELQDGFTMYSLMPRIEVPTCIVQVCPNETDQAEIYAAPNYTMLPDIRSKILSATLANTASKKNLLSWLQVYRSRSWTIRDHPTNITPLYFASLSGWRAGVEKILNTTYAGGFSCGTDLTHALRGAAIAGSKDLVELLLDNGADIHGHGDSLGSALQAASFLGRKEVVETFLERGARAEEPNTFFRAGGTVGSALGGVAAKGDERIVDLLLRGGADINNPRGWTGTPLQKVLEHNNLRMAQFLIDRGADASIPGGFYGSALNLSDYEMVKLAIHNVHDVNRRIGNYGDALQAAAYYGETSKVELLLENGANPRAPHGQYGNALQAAAIRGHEEVASALLKFGADVNAPGEWIGASLHLPTLPYHGKALKFIEGQGYREEAKTGFFGPAVKAAVTLRRAQHNHILLLLEKEPTNRSSHYGNPLQAACFIGNMKLIELLLESGGDVNATGGLYGNPLQAAAAQGHIEAVTLLLEHHANPNAPGGLYQNAVQGAATMGHWNIVDLLSRNGADLSIVDEHGWTARMCASHFHGYHAEISSTLTSLSQPGAIPNTPGPVHLIFVGGYGTHWLFPSV